jgi:hypothetical protein
MGERDLSRAGFEAARERDREKYHGGPKGQQVRGSIVIIDSEGQLWCVGCLWCDGSMTYDLWKQINSR